ncbi:MAG: FAD-dependent oxidoreductase [Actinobacteria bacterium 13_2_20CM_2_71_6]|nr:MAG: FAD-dependent oxidoreductase [Actinobacteria bacterium 13_2_20CM_2_71_6]
MYDVIVVGARCAGSPTAMLFARKGYRVLLLERATFPRDTLSTHYIHQPAVARMARWGVLDAVIASGCPPIDKARYEVADLRLEGCSEPVEGHRAAYGPRRHVLDQILAEAAVASGVELRTSVTVRDVVFDGDRAVGVRLRGDTGQEYEERARLVVGADGMRSTIAEKVGAPLTVEDPLMTCTWYSYWTGVPAVFELYEAPDRWVGSVPTNDGATLITTYFPQAEFDRVRKNTEAEYLANVAQTAPDLYERMIAGERVERLRGTGDQRNFFRQAYGPGWALVGDAGHHKDSITARGISDAFLQAELLVESIGDRLHDEAALTKALRRYARQRDSQLSDIYQTTLIVAQLTVGAERLELLRAIASTPEGVERYFSTVSGVCPVEELYVPELLPR